MQGIPYYQAAAASNVVVRTGPCVLVGIYIGADVATSTIQVSDSATSGSADVKLKMTGSTLMTANGGFIPCCIEFLKGITADITNQTNVTFIFKPL